MTAAQYLKTTPLTIGRLVEIGMLKVTRPKNGRPYFKKSDLDACQAELIANKAKEPALKRAKRRGKVSGCRVSHQVLS